MGTIDQYRTIADFEPQDFAPMQMQGLPDQDVVWRNISFDQETGQGSYLMMMAAGTRCNPHRHEGPEEFYMVEGDLRDHDGCLYTAGQFISLEPGSEHFSVSPSGCKLLVTQRGPTTNLFHGELET